MVSFWPFKGDDNSAEAFERLLRELSGKISRASARHDRFRQKQRRYKALWSLYTTFGYILVAAILTLVTGWERWSTIEYTAMAGGPVLIFGGRTVIDTYYDWRATGTQEYVNTLSKQREGAIERLKKATKYNSTQQLLDKYGGSPSPGKLQQSPHSKEKRKSDIGPKRPETPQSGRTGFAPPPTANVQRAPPPTANIPRNQPFPAQGHNGSTASASQNISPPMKNGAGEEFAPNAFSAPQNPPPGMRRPSMYAAEGPKWYDRVLDVVLGEDETSAKNRIALICQSCRLVNGQAPPGARSLQDVGKWRCSACHAWNGVESEEKQILQQLQVERQVDPREPMSAVTDPGPATKRFAAENDEAIEDDEQPEQGDESLETPPSASTRSRTGQLQRKV